MTQSATTTQPVEGENTNQCCHYWVIQPATGPVSQGVCQTCGESREFKNYVEASTWGDDKASGRTGGRAQVPTPPVSADIEEEE